MFPLSPTPQHSELHMCQVSLVDADSCLDLLQTDIFDLMRRVCHVQVVTVNCARIIYGNQVATNGVVHVIDRVISSVGNTIQDVIEVTDELSTLSVSTQR